MLKYVQSCVFCVLVLVNWAQPNYDLKKGIELTWKSEYDSSEVLLTKIIQNTSDNSAKDIGLAYMYLGRVKQLKSDYSTSIVFFHKALKIFKTEQEDNLIAECKVWLSEYHRSLSQYDDGKKYILEVQKLEDENKLSDFTKALFYTRVAAFSNELDNDPKRIKVLKYSNLAIELSKKLGNKDIEATSINEIGFAYENMGDPRSIAYYLDAYSLWTQSGNKYYAVYSLINVVREYIKRNEYKKAVFYAEKGYDISIEKQYGELTQYFSSQIMQGEEHLGNYEKSLKFSHIFHDQYELEMLNKWSNTVLEIEKKYDLQQEKERTNIEKNKAEVANLKAKKNKTQRNYSIFISFLLVVFLLTVLYFSNNLRTKNNELKLGLEQKQVLLKEVYHRVKNNLTFLSSLLFLRAKATKETSVQEMLYECQSRVHSMAIVHQQLYQLSEDTLIDFHVFCEQLFSELEVVGSQGNTKIEYQVEGNIKELNLNNSIFVGLIINELAINSIKHAVNVEKLKIGIELERLTTSFDIKFYDNGLGLPEAVSQFQDGGFGFQMIRLLTKQLNGTINYYTNTNRHYFHLQIPFEK